MEFCEENEILFICDDKQVGCYRTGPFFFFEKAGIYPDMVTLSKSLSGFETTMSIVLIKPEYDCWYSGVHSGTFRGNQLGMVGGKVALKYAESVNISAQVM